MSDILNDDLLAIVLSIIDDYERRGYKISFETAFKYMDNPDAISKMLIAEKPVIDNSREILDEKKSIEREKLLSDLSKLDDYNNSIDYDLVDEILLGNSGSSNQLLSLYIQEFLIKHPNGFANNNCVAGAGSSRSNSSSVSIPRCNSKNFNCNCDNCNTSVNYVNNNNNNNSNSSSASFCDSNSNYSCRVSCNNNNFSSSSSSYNSISRIGDSKGSSDENTLWTCFCTYQNPTSINECDFCDRKRVY